MCRASERERKAIMFSSLIVVVVALICSSKMALAQCPCYEYDTSSMICAKTSLTSIPNCVPNEITELTINTPSIPLVADTIRRLTNLVRLHIQDFNNPKLSKLFLNGKRSISTFGIVNTSLEYVNRDWFLFTPSIKTLYLYSNKIPSLAADTFRSLPLLEAVSLYDNRLTTLPPNLFLGTNLKRIFLRDNPWHCDCELAKFMDWLRKNNVSVLDEAYCSYPEDLQGLELIDLKPNAVCNDCFD